MKIEAGQMSDIWRDADAAGKSAAGKLTEDDIGRRYCPFLFLFTHKETVKRGKELKESGIEPTNLWGKTCYKLPTPMYTTFEHAWAYAEAAAKVLRQEGLDICHGVLRIEESVEGYVGAPIEREYPKSVVMIVRK